MNFVDNFKNLQTRMYYYLGESETISTTQRNQNPQYHATTEGVEEEDHLM